MSVPSELRRLRKELERAKALSSDAIARCLPPFRCVRCARCCRGAYGDNTVTVFPDEVRAIMSATGRGWLDVAEPEEAGDLDPYGNRHAFEWALRKKPDGDCIFLHEGRCAIYDLRPHICRTYPFYLEGAKVETCECDGLSNGTMDREGPKAVAQELKARRVRELEESISLLENLDLEAGRGARGRIVVHDSDGARLVAGEDVDRQSRDARPR